MEIQFDDIRHVYFLGIGGIGMSALARYFNLKGKAVSGYDKTKTPLTEKLEEEGMEIHYDEDPDKIPTDIDMIVFTPAIPANHAEWQTLRERNVPLMKRAEVLGMISRAYKTIAIAGTHGKTSTSSMTSFFLRAAGLDVTAFLGGIVKDFESNFMYGKSEWVVVEADEFDRSFMHLTPEISVLLSLDPDHLDIYGDHDEMLKTFKDFSLQLKSGGKLLVASTILDKIDNTWRKELLEKGIEMYSFGVHEGWFSARNLQAKNHRFGFDFYSNNTQVLKTGIAMPGNHNVSNATAALGIGNLLGLDSKELAEGVRGFKGIRRRFDFQVIRDACVYIDDYAHHPTEIKAAIKAARNLYPDRKLTVIFQPHLFTRTRDFMVGFAEELSAADELILMDIYPARELPIEGIETRRIKELIGDEDIEILDENAIIKKIENQKSNIEVLMTLGAGNIDRLVKPLREILE